LYKEFNGVAEIVWKLVEVDELECVWITCSNFRTS
jgi:hypothetical protein